MAENSEKSFPFDADPVGDPADERYDREYYAEDWARYFRAFISSGTFLTEPTNLQIIANGDMTVTLKPGSMIIDGYRYDNVSDIVIKLEPADGVLSRIDRISITWSATDRDIHYTLQKGNMSYKPIAPECRRTAEYKDYVIADIEVPAGTINISQTNIVDQRLNSEVCGLAVPFTEINTNQIFLQLQAFYDQTVANNSLWEQEEKERMNEYCTELTQRGENLYTQYEGYINNLKAKGDSDLAAITQQLIDFRNTNETKYLEWFEMIKGILNADAAGNLLLQIKELNGQVEEMQEMLFTGMIRAELSTSEGDTIIDSMGNTIMIGRPICKCAV